MQGYKVVRCTEKGVLKCADTVKQGGVVVYPTDTVYGIGCSPYSNSAVERVLRIKGRNESKPLPVLVYNSVEAEKLVDLGQKGRLLASKYWPGSLTIVAPIVDRSIDSKVKTGSDTLGVRVPANKCARSLLKHCRCIVGTSANISGEPSMTSAVEVQNSRLDGFDILLDGGSVELGRASTIIDTTNLNIIREGAITKDEIYNFLGEGSN